MIRATAFSLLFVGCILLFFHQLGQVIGRPDPGASATVCGWIDTPAKAAFSPRPVEHRQ